jgi:hypothetical protein
MTIQTALEPWVAAAEMSVFWGRTEYHAPPSLPGTICSSGRVQMLETGNVAASSRAEPGVAPGSQTERAKFRWY